MRREEATPQISLISGAKRKLRHLTERGSAWSKGNGDRAEREGVK